MLAGPKGVQTWRHRGPQGPGFGPGPWGPQLGALIENMAKSARTHFFLFSTGRALLGPTTAKGPLWGQGPRPLWALSHCWPRATSAWGPWPCWPRALEPFSQGRPFLPPPPLASGRNSSPELNRAPLEAAGVPTCRLLLPLAAGRPAAREGSSPGPSSGPSAKGPSSRALGPGPRAEGPGGPAFKAFPGARFSGCATLTLARLDQGATGPREPWATWPLAHANLGPSRSKGGRAT